MSWKERRRHLGAKGEVGRVKCCWYIRFYWLLKAGISPVQAIYELKSTIIIIIIPRKKAKKDNLSFLSCLPFYRLAPGPSSTVLPASLYRKPGLLSLESSRPLALRRRLRTIKVYSCIPLLFPLILPSSPFFLFIVPSSSPSHLSHISVANFSPLYSPVFYWLSGFPLWALTR